MPNKSDSAGKLHQYYTAKSLSIKNNCKFKSPLEDISNRSVHERLFNEADLKSLKIIGDKTAQKIMTKFNTNIALVEDIGLSSGAVGINNTDDLKVIFDDDSVATFSLKCAQNISQILSKNMGAKSLLKEYFKAPSEQFIFNSDFEKDYVFFLKQALNSSKTDIKGLKKEIEEDAKKNGLTKARFADEQYRHMNNYRNSFLNAISNNLKNLLTGLNKSNLANACDIILDTEKHHYIGLYKNGKETVDYSYTDKLTQGDIIDISLRGNDSVVIETKNYLVGFRYKFESGITSSIKLVGDYKKK